MTVDPPRFWGCRRRHCGRRCHRRRRPTFRRQRRRTQPSRQLTAGGACPRRRSCRRCRPSRRCCRCHQDLAPPRSQPRSAAASSPPAPCAAAPAAAASRRGARCGARRCTPAAPRGTCGAAPTPRAASHHSSTFRLSCQRNELDGVTAAQLFNNQNGYLRLRAEKWTSVRWGFIVSVVTTKGYLRLRADEKWGTSGPSCGRAHMPQTRRWSGRRSSAGRSARSARSSPRPATRCARGTCGSAACTLCCTCSCTRRWCTGN
mmetsp:Transcript_28259/g.69586  ORF Transcript_28259/g.69586 Transcript_28259/m.69586 type:complete len:260 (+) Transcript_28259:1272-2051(+)